MAKPSIRLVKSPAAMASALGVPLTPAFRKDLAEYQRWTDWPKGGTKGVPVDDLIAFFVRNKAKVAQRKILASVIDPTSANKTTGADLKLISESNLAGVGGNPALPNCNTQATLARTLEKWRVQDGRLKIEINPQLLNDWRKGSRLPADAPEPPPKLRDTNYWSAEEWVAWLVRWIIPHHSRHEVEVEGETISSAKLEQMRLQDEVEQLKANQRQREIEEGKFIRKEDAARIRRGALRILRGMFRRAHEHVNPTRRTEWLQSRLPPDDLIGFREFDLKLERGVVDLLETECEKASQAAPENEPAH